MSFPVTRPTGRAMLVGNPASRADSLSILTGLGYACAEADDVYSAFADLCRSADACNAVILSLASLYKEELQAIVTIKRRFPQMEVWLAQAEGRHAAMIEAIRLGADGLLAEDGLHRIGMPTPGNATGEGPWPDPGDSAGDPQEKPHPSRPARSNGSSRRRNIPVEDRDDRDEFELDLPVGEPVLSAEELRALLQEEPFLPPSGDD
ncbi:MAG TPA: response regulator [Tepidisphaeraceae bacterium]|nr:response regulator [Tepidisphaeraceae bacterium]